MSEYFHVGDKHRFPFYRIPKALFAEQNYRTLSTDAKLLYGLIYDRMELSAQNGWSDEYGRVFIYFTIRQACDLLNCGHDKVGRLFAELEQHGLIERRRQGLGKASIIYPKIFRIAKSDVQKSENQTSGERKSRFPDIGKADGNHTEYNNTEMSDTNLSIRYDADEIESRIREQIDYDVLCTQYEYEKVDEITALMTEMLSITADAMRIGKYTYPTDLVHSRIGSLQAYHIEYVLDCMAENHTKIRNIKAYLMAALFNAPATAEHHIQADVNSA